MSDPFKILEGLIAGGASSVEFDKAIPLLKQAIQSQRLGLNQLETSPADVLRRLNTLESAVVKLENTQHNHQIQLEKLMATRNEQKIVDKMILRNRKSE